MIRTWHLFPCECNLRSGVQSGIMGWVNLIWRKYSSESPMIGMLYRIGVELTPAKMWTGYRRKNLFRLCKNGGKTESGNVYISKGWILFWVRIEDIVLLQHRFYSNGPLTVSLSSCAGGLCGGVRTPCSHWSPVITAQIMNRIQMFIFPQLAVMCWLWSSPPPNTHTHRASTESPCNTHQRVESVIYTTVPVY